MASTNQNFTMYTGNSKRINVTVTNSDGTVLDLTGVTIRWVLKRNVYDTTSVVEKSTGDGITISDAMNGKFVINLLHLDTAGQIGVFYHEAELEDSAGNISTILSGTITINKAGI